MQDNMLVSKFFLVNITQPCMNSTIFHENASSPHEIKYAGTDGSLVNALDAQWGMHILTQENLTLLVIAIHMNNVILNNCYSGFYARN